MNYSKKLVLTKNLQEVIAYPNIDFPLEIWTGNLNEYFNSELSTHYHDVFEYAMVIKGKVIYKINEDEILLNENEAIFINSDVIHTVKQYKDDNAIIYTIGFPSNLLVNDPTNILFKKYFEPIIYGNYKYLLIKNKDMLSLMNSIYTDNKKEYNELHFLSLLIELWSYTFNEISKLNPIRNTSELVNEERIKTILAYIHEHYNEKINVEDLADLLKISKNTCFRLFKKYLSKTPTEYILDYRINKAATLLLHSNKNMITIAIECGFDNASYFGKVFKEKTNYSPLEYRKINHSS